MKTISELMAEHREKNEFYEGSPVAPLPSYPERDGDMKSWEHWEQEQCENCRRWLRAEFFDRLDAGKPRQYQLIRST